MFKFLFSYDAKDVKNLVLDDKLRVIFKIED
jgi:hypothetical protein